MFENVKTRLRSETLCVLEQISPLSLMIHLGNWIMLNATTEVFLQIYQSRLTGEFDASYDLSFWTVRGYENRKLAATHSAKMIALLKQNSDIKTSTRTCAVFRFSKRLKFRDVFGIPLNFENVSMLAVLQAPHDAWIQRFFTIVNKLIRSLTYPDTSKVKV